jgi:hypothetical protein
MTVSSGQFNWGSFRAVVGNVLSPLLVLAAVLAWWWLVKIQTEDEGQKRVLRIAFLAFALQYLLTSAFYLFVLTPIRSFGDFWETTALWSDLVGAFLSALGLFLFSRLFVDTRHRADPITQSPGPGVVTS